MEIKSENALNSPKMGGESRLRTQKEENKEKQSKSVGDPDYRVRISKESINTSSQTEQPDSLGMDVNTLKEHEAAGLAVEVGKNLSGIPQSITNQSTQQMMSILG